MLSYGTLVTVIAGFYMNCYGTVQDYKFDLSEYYVSMSCKDGNGQIDLIRGWIRADDLQKVEKKK